MWDLALQLKAEAKGHFQACVLRLFGALLSPAAVVEVAVAICLKSLLIYPIIGPVIISEMCMSPYPF